MIWIAIAAILLLGFWVYGLSRKVGQINERIIELSRFKPMLDYLERDLRGTPPTDAQARALFGWPKD